ncbi:MAG: serpin family protein [Oscillospiraceae bacterium]|nr:serpin family protein [Oscillospiraceae bacterium]
MSKESEKIFDGITRVGDDLVESAQKPKKRKNPWRRWTAAAAAVALVILGAFALRRGGTPGKGPADAPEQPPAYGVAEEESPAMVRELSLVTFACAEAERPEMAQRPVETAFSDAKGKVDWDAYNGAWETWRESCLAQTEEMDVYRGKLDGFLDKSIPVLLDGEAGENRVCSPLNVYLALAMLAQTTDGNTRAQLLSLLGASDTTELRERARALWNANYLDDGVSESLLSSSLWMREDVPFVQRTLDVLAADYHASSYRGKMGSSLLNAAMQKWLNENTGGLLEKQVAGVETEENTLLTILTAVYLNAPWTNAFPKFATAPDTFHAADGDRTCDFLHGSAEGMFYRGERFTATEKKLNLGFHRGGMWFLLPDEGVSPEALLRDEDALRFLRTDKYAGADGQLLTWNTAAADVRLHVPKFDVDAQMDLIPGLQALGVTDVFRPGVADFSPMIENAGLLQPCVSGAQHAARVKIDEEGVEAAAFTEFSVTESAAVERKEIDFTLDRPFLFAITGADGLPLFVGIVNRPA